MIVDRNAVLDSVMGLSLGDAFGRRWFSRSAAEARREIAARRLPDVPGPGQGFGPGQVWRWTDDTAMALGILGVLLRHGEIVEEELARAFADAYAADPGRGYGAGMHDLLPLLGADPGAWRTAARALFDGQGSLGNGAAMRAAPLGAWFGPDLETTVEQARRSAHVTHAHPEGIAGAVAVAVAAALAVAGRPDHEARWRQSPGAREGVLWGADLLRAVAAHTPAGPTRDGILRAADLPDDTPAWKAADILGNGRRIRADDTVPFALWCAAHHLGSLTDALWTTAEGLGDVDTTCAITGGVVAARNGRGDMGRAGPAIAPGEWLHLVEILPNWVYQGLH
ncbi:ADP-ribosylglycohydrolase family protein [Actinoallomurus soli]|uniref:ADP-ribosylglycohydrolase family protein n=1 Tax=Actinoallomurus soli TaxID=2952535 RepID=UPI00209328C6|nr:ADP-ribosylglycohydrolase family protein [Actinoallomurus soli]MCO5966846.1 ADP-ribosylglycohydrolase family protein [Actinoallomurus soli]